MASNFKCCKDKPQNNFVCVTCKNVFHPSCIKRSGNYTVINRNLIWCSVTCAEKAVEHEEPIRSLESKVDELEEKLRQQSDYIQKMRRNSCTFEDQAIEANQKLIAEVENKIKVIADLTALTDDLSAKLELCTSRVLVDNSTQIDRGSMLTRATQTGNTRVVNAMLQTDGHPCIRERGMQTSPVKNISDVEMSLEKQLKIMEEQRQELLVTVETLNADNNCYAKKLLRFEESGSDCYVRSSNTIPGVTVDEVSKKMLILGDQTVCSFKKMLMNCPSVSNFKVQSIIKPYALSGQVTNNISALTQNFDEDDMVIILAGLNDLSKRKYPSFRHLNTQLKKCLNTNIMLVSVPFLRGNNSINKIIFKFNCKLSEYAFRLNKCVPVNVKYVEINHSSDLNFIFNKESNVKNLTFIKTINTEHFFVEKLVCENGNSNHDNISLSSGLDDEVFIPDTMRGVYDVPDSIAPINRDPTVSLQPPKDVEDIVKKFFRDQYEI